MLVRSNESAIAGPMERPQELAPFSSRQLIFVHSWARYQLHGTDFIGSVLSISFHNMKPVQELGCRFSRSSYNASTLQEKVLSRQLWGVVVIFLAVILLVVGLGPLYFSDIALFYFLSDVWTSRFIVPAVILSVMFFWYLNWLSLTFLRHG